MIHADPVVGNIVVTEGGSHGEGTGVFGASSTGGVLQLAVWGGAQFEMKTPSDPPASKGGTPSEVSMP